MSEALYERYKDALRRGHVAAQRGRHDAALEAYGEASRIAPDRALPLVGIAGVLTRLARPVEALAAYDAALDRAPADEAALRGRGALLLETGDRAAAAATFDRLAAALDGAGRLAEATDVACQALAFAESRGRRDTVRGYVERLGAMADDPAAAAALAAAQLALDGRGETSRDGGASEPAAPAPPPFDGARATAAVEDAAAAGDHAAARALALEAAAGHRATGHAAAAIDVCYIALAGTPAASDLHLTLAELYLDRGWRTTAIDKLLLLDRLAVLVDDASTRERVASVVATRLADEPRLAALHG